MVSHHLVMFGGHWSSQGILFEDEWRTFFKMIDLFFKTVMTLL